MKNVLEFMKMKRRNEKITMVTCYDYTMATILNQSDVDCLLVGDSAAMVMHGHPSTVTATMDMMELHTQAVARGATNKFVIADLPFLSYRKGLRHTMDNVQRLMQAGAAAVKLENATDHIDLIQHIVDSGVPVMGHLGLTAQSIHQLGGWKVQAKNEVAQKILMEQAEALQAAGCFSIVLECMPSQFAEAVTEKLVIPTIGIGAGLGTSGQVLVLQDMLGMNAEFKPKFVKSYLEGFSLIEKSFNKYVLEVKNKQYPEAQHSYD